MNAGLRPLISELRLRRATLRDGLATLRPAMGAGTSLDIQKRREEAPGGTDAAASGGAPVTHTVRGPVHVAAN